MRYVPLRCPLLLAPTCLRLRRTPANPQDRDPRVAPIPARVATSPRARLTPPVAVAGRDLATSRSWLAMKDGVKAKLESISPRRRAMKLLTAEPRWRRLLADVQLPAERVEFNLGPSQPRAPPGLALILGRVDDQMFATLGSRQRPRWNRGAGRRRLREACSGDDGTRHDGRRESCCDGNHAETTRPRAMRFLSEARPPASPRLPFLSQLIPWLDRELPWPCPTCRHSLR